MRLWTWCLPAFQKLLLWPSSNLPAWTDHLWVAGMPLTPPWNASASLAPLGGTHLAQVTSLLSMMSNKALQVGTTRRLLSELHTCSRLKCYYRCCPHSVTWKRICNSIDLSHWTQVNLINELCLLCWWAVSFFGLLFFLKATRMNN